MIQKASKLTIHSFCVWMCGLALATIALNCGCNKPPDPYEFRLGITGGKYAPDSVAVNGETIKFDAIREKKSQVFDYVVEEADIVTRNPNINIEWKENGTVYRAELLLNRPGLHDFPAVYITTDRWQDGHRHLLIGNENSRYFRYMMLFGGVELRALLRDGAAIPPEIAAREINFDER